MKALDKASLLSHGPYPINQLEALQANQIKSWKMMADGADALRNISIKDLNYHGVNLKIQLNSRRTTSVTAKIDQKSISDRPCFLCENNRPPEQVGALFAGYLFLCNPMPLFPFHLTIVDENHTPQDLNGKTNHIIDLVRTINDDRFLVFFNGAKSGASAPDHIQFQGCLKDQLPLIHSLHQVPVSASKIITLGYANLCELGENNFIHISCSDYIILCRALDYFIAEVGSDSSNIAVFKDNNSFHLILFGRKQHRPSVFHSGKHIVSVATVEMLGLIITIRDDDYNYIDQRLMDSIYSEVCFNKQQLNDIFLKVTDKL